MSNIKEALLQAQRPQGPPQGSGPSEAWAAKPRTTLGREMLELHMNVEALLPMTPRKIIQFTGSRGGEGVSTIVREYACMAAAELGKSVLILDAVQAAEGPHFSAHLKNGYGWNDALRGLVAID